ncbi:hypothetical protein GCM10027174_27410 [Salinifilum aidingensis]
MSGGVYARGGRLSQRQQDAIERGLARLDTSSHRGPWTRWLLGRLCGGPVRAAEVAAEVHRPVSRVKSDVWRLRELGLVESAPEGFHLSEVGRAFWSGSGA